MIRFCDREVSRTNYTSLTIRGLLTYFSSDHKDDIVCVYDDLHGMEYLGIITYHSLKHSHNIDEVILREHVVLNANLWQNARDYFAQRLNLENDLLPVLNKKGQLVSFAYEESGANRQIRMLRELQEIPTALQFHDVYPEYRYVKIYEFNELAYFFAQYLAKQNITVQVEGAMWEGFWENSEWQALDYECLTIYAEGTCEKKYNWKENLLRSVSVEFECIDKIYEVNIKNNLIKDTLGDCAALIERLQSEEEIILYGTGKAEQDAYDFLTSKGIDICCFVDTLHTEQNHRLLGKKIISEIEARHTYKNAVFIDCVSQNSAWGGVKIDYYDYIGYRRNEKFILLKDYIDNKGNNLINILTKAKVVLLGDTCLCNRLYGWLKQKAVSVCGYLRTSSEDSLLQELPEIKVEDIDEETICLLIAPIYFLYNGFTWFSAKNELVNYLVQNGLNNYTDYFSDMGSFDNIEGEKIDKYTKEWLKPKRIVLGGIESCCGNALFRGILDNHPSVSFIHYSDLCNNLFWICCRLASENPSNILSQFWEILEDDKIKFIDSSKFNVKMKQLLACGNEFTSQELFVIVHIAYAYMCGKTIEANDIKNIVIYWEPHMWDRFVVEEHAKWLGNESVPCDIINIVRNICMRNGSTLKFVQDEGLVRAYNKTLFCPPIDKKSYNYSKRMVVKFEELKCNPAKVLTKICTEWDIVWSDTFMETTCYGKKTSWNNRVREVSGFDLEPVYNLYENFYSEFDRFRLTLIHAPWQRKYGYPYVELSQFTRKELQEMFLKGFRFENLGDTETYKDSLNYRIELQEQIREKLQRVRRIELLLCWGVL